MTPEYMIKSMIALLSTAAVSFFILGTTCSADFSDNGPPDRAALDAAFESCGVSKPTPGNPPSLSDSQVQCMTDAGFPPPPDMPGHGGGHGGPGAPNGRGPGSDDSQSDPSSMMDRS